MTGEVSAVAFAASMMHSAGASASSEFTDTITLHGGTGTAYVQYSMNYSLSLIGGGDAADSQIQRPDGGWNFFSSSFNDGPFGWNLIFPFPWDQPFPFGLSATVFGDGGQDSGDGDSLDLSVNHITVLNAPLDCADFARTGTCLLHPYDGALTVATGSGVAWLNAPQALPEPSPFYLTAIGFALALGFLARKSSQRQRT